MERRPLNTCALGVTSRIVVLTYQHLGDFILPRCSKPRGCFGQWLAHLVRDDGLEPPTPTCKDGALPTELIAHGPACACGWHQIHDVLRREPVNGRAHIESNAGFSVVLHLMQGQPNLWSEGWELNPLTQREQIYSPPRLSDCAALRNK